MTRGWRGRVLLIMFAVAIWVASSVLRSSPDGSTRQVIAAVVVIASIPVALWIGWTIYRRAQHKANDEHDRR